MTEVKSKIDTGGGGGGTGGGGGGSGGNSRANSKKVRGSVKSNKKKKPPNLNNLVRGKEKQFKCFEIIVLSTNHRRMTAPTSPPPPDGDTQIYDPGSAPGTVAQTSRRPFRNRPGKQMHFPDENVK